MADRELMDPRDQADVRDMDYMDEVVTGAGRVGVIAAAIETQQQRVIIAGQD